MGYNLNKLKEIAQPRSKEAIDKFNKRYLRRHNKTEKEFTENAVKLLTKDFNMTKEEAESMAKLAVMLNKNNL